MLLIWHDNAKCELKKCTDYIAERSSIDTTKKWRNKIEKSLKTLEIFPKAGRKIGKYRRWQAHKNYYVLYETYDDFVYIVHFRHSKRKPLEYKAK
ncbi:hypothetical protein R83H12_02177 [Fibrobacteria bacterium R8-3-H12]